MEVAVRAVAYAYWGRYYVQFTGNKIGARGLVVELTSQPNALTGELSHGLGLGKQAESAECESAGLQPARVGTVQISSDGDTEGISLAAGVTRRAFALKP